MELILAALITVNLAIGNTFLQAVSLNNSTTVYIMGYISREHIQSFANCLNEMQNLVGIKVGVANCSMHYGCPKPVPVIQKSRACRRR